jgi:RNA polymerase sigma-70 factor (ECF subfamily)
MTKVVALFHSKMSAEATMAGVGRTGSAAPPREVALPTFAELYHAHFKFVWRTLRRLGVADSEVDDATQDVFVVVYRRLGDFRPDAPIKHWLFRIASRIARDHRRARQRKDPKQYGLEPVTELEAVADLQEVGPAESVERNAAARLIREILSELDDAKREVFILADLEQMTAPEIADVLGVPVNTVYSRLRAARREFEDGLARRRDEEGGRR